jgi:hypothetical protein
MTIIEAITILEIATVECRNKDVDKPDVNQALDVVELYVRPEWVVPQFRYHLLREGNNAIDIADQQAVLNATFSIINDCLKELVRKTMEALACEFDETLDLKVKEEIWRLVREYTKFKDSWEFVAR